MDFRLVPSAPSRSTPQSRGACPSRLPRSRCASPLLARSSQQTLHRRTQGHHVHRSSDSKRSSRKFYFHGSRRQSPDILYRFHGWLRLDLHRQKLWVHADTQPPFAKQLSPVEHLVGIHLVSSGHSCYRGSRHQGLFHDVPFLFNGSPTFLHL